MLFMNEYDIDQATRQFHGDPVVGPAVATLVNLAIFANNHSDGWAYWPKPCRAAKQLQELILRAQANERSPIGGARITADEVRRAYRPIRSFYTRHAHVGQPEPIIEPR